MDGEQPPVVEVEHHDLEESAGPVRTQIQGPGPALQTNGWAESRTGVRCTRFLQTWSAAPHGTPWRPQWPIQAVARPDFGEPIPAVQAPRAPGPVAPGAPRRRQGSR